MGDSIYDSMGIDAHKGSVVETFKPIVDNIYPYAFVNITRDPLLPGYVRTLKVDGDGSKPTLHSLYFLETGDPIFLGNSADDDFAMVAADMAAAGFVHELLFADGLDVNRFPIPGLKEALMTAYGQRIQGIIELHRKYGFSVEFFGGETADLPSQVAAAYISNGFSFGRTHEKYIIQGNVQPGDSIWGFSSGGQAVWEKKPISPLMCNGVTLVGSVVLWEGYNEKYPFLRHEKNKFRGRYKIDDKPEGLGGMTAIEAVCSPTRQWAIVFRLLIDELERQNALHLLHGLTVNTGGGATKTLRLGHNICYHKKMPSWSPFFDLIHEEGNVPAREMYEDFNCVVGADVIGSNEGGILELAIHNVSLQTKVSCWRLGKCVWCDNPKNKVILETPYGGPFTYPEEK